MMAIIKLRLLGLKEDYKIMLVMALLALAMVYAFSAQGGRPLEGWYTSLLQNRLYLRI